MVSTISISVFWISSCFIVYTYLLYPLIIALLAKTRGITPLTPPSSWPTVSLIIPVYNEEANIHKKLKNLDELDYPKELLNITFVSDGSNDRTVEILSNTPWVTLLIQATRKGKPAALNLAARSASSEILVFTDARQTLSSGAIKKLVSRLQQEQVGAVSGELIHYDSDSKTAQSVGLYWRYEKWIRANESRFASVPGVTGALYAIRRSDFSAIEEDTLLDDFEIPIKVLKSRKRILFESEAVIYDKLQEDIKGEKVRKIRTLTGNFQSFSRNNWLFSPFQNSIWFQFISHKVFRLIVPYALILTLISSALITHWFYQCIFYAQLCFYVLAILGHYNEKARKNKIISFADVFLGLNIAAVQAFFEFRKSNINVKWEKTS